MGKGEGFDYDRAGYAKSEAQSRYAAQSAFCAQGGTPPWKSSDGQWKMKGKTVSDPAGPFTPSSGGKEKKGGK